MRAYRNPVMDEAAGAVDREWRQMARLALQIREKRCSPIWAEQQEKKFTGIFKRLLEDPIEELKLITRR